MTRACLPVSCWLAAVVVTTASVHAEFRAGATKTDITPKAGVSMDGPISKPGPVTGVHDRLHARALVLDDGTTRLALVVCDSCVIGSDVYDAAKTKIRKETGLGPDRVLTAATHSHATPRAIHIGTGPLDDEYHEFLAGRIAEAVIEAEKNLAPARVGFGSFEKPEFVKCRRLLCEPGSVGPNPFGETGERVASVSAKSSQVIKPAGPVDPQVSILSVEHADGTPLAVLANYSVHYCGGYQRGLISADYFGYFAQSLEERLDSRDDHPPLVGIMSNGTSGSTGSIQSSGKRGAPFEWMQVAAGILADEAVQVVKQIDHRSDVTLAMRQAELDLGLRRPDEQRLAWAKGVLADPAAKRPHRWTTIYARDAVHLAGLPARQPVRLQALRIGEVGIAAIPCEVFAETGLAIKQESPHKATFTIELANDYCGYLPTPQQHEWGGYETWPARSSRLEPQAEPKIRAEILRLLREVDAE